jgi:molybdenum cofactor synthesis domain-containing protein
MRGEEEKKEPEKEDHVHYHGVDRAEAHISVAEALKIILDNIAPTGPETVDAFHDSHGRVLFQDVTARIDIPGRTRSTRDGYAVRITKDVPEPGHTLEVVGEVAIGTSSRLSLRPGEAARVATGSYLPGGADSVVMKEYVSISEGRGGASSSITVDRPIKVDDNLLHPGEDISKGELLLRRGVRISPQHVALLSMLGTRTVRVFRRPKVAFFSTGDELVDVSGSGRPASGGSWIYDSNRPFISAAVSELGAEAVDLGIARDNVGEIRAKLVEGLRNDALLISAGSSVGERDYVTRAMSSIGGVKTLVHGVAMRPSSPTGLAAYRGRPVISLPGFPTSAIVSFLVFGRPSILKLSGASDVGYPLIKARLLDGYSGKKGITHFIRVAVTRKDDEYQAKLVTPTEAQFSRWLSIANGIAVIETKDGGSAEAGQDVDVFLVSDLG